MQLEYAEKEDSYLRSKEVCENRGRDKSHTGSTWMVDLDKNSTIIVYFLILDSCYILI